MIVLVWVALGAALIGFAAFAWRLKRRRDTPEELRGEWWPRFEAEFREYARCCEMPGRGIRQRRSQSRPSQRRDLAEGSA